MKYLLVIFLLVIVVFSGCSYEMGETSSLSVEDKLGEIVSSTSDGEETTSIIEVSGCDFPFEKRVEIVMLTDSGLLESYQTLR